MPEAGGSLPEHTEITTVTASPDRHLTVTFTLHDRSLAGELRCPPTAAIEVVATGLPPDATWTVSASPYDESGRDLEYAIEAESRGGTYDACLRAESWNVVDAPATDAVRVVVPVATKWLVDPSSKRHVLQPARFDVVAPSTSVVEAAARKSPLLVRVVDGAGRKVDVPGAVIVVVRGGGGRVQRKLTGGEIPFYGLQPGKTGTFPNGSTLDVTCVLDDGRRLEKSLPAAATGVETVLELPLGEFVAPELTLTLPEALRAVEVARVWGRTAERGPFSLGDAPIVFGWTGTYWRRADRTTIQVASERRLTRVWVAGASGLVAAWERNGDELRPLAEPRARETVVRLADAFGSGYEAAATIWIQARIEGTWVDFGKRQVTLWEDVRVTITDGVEYRLMAAMSKDGEDVTLYHRL